MNQGIGLAEALLGLSGFRVLTVRENSDELVVSIQTTATRAACSSCGTWAEPHERKPVAFVPRCRDSAGPSGWCGASGAGVA